MARLRERSPSVRVPKTKTFRVSIDFGSTKAVVAAISTDQPGEPFLIRRWPGSSVGHDEIMPAVVYVKSANQLGFGIPPVTMDPTKTFRMIKILTLKPNLEDPIEQGLREQLKEQGLSPEKVLHEFAEFLRRHTLEELRGVVDGETDVQFASVTLCIPVILQDDDEQQKVLKDAFRGWNIANVGIMKTEVECLAHLLLTKNAHIQSQAKSPGGLFLTVIDAGGMVMNCGAFHLQTWTFPDNVSHTVLSQVGKIPPVSYQAGSTYVLNDLAQRFGCYAWQYYDQFLMQANSDVEIHDINHVEGVWGRKDIHKSMYIAFDKPAKLIRRYLRRAVKQAESQFPDLPRIILIGGGSTTSQRFLRDLKASSPQKLGPIITGFNEIRSAIAKGALCTPRHLAWKHIETVLDSSAFGVLKVRSEEAPGSGGGRGVVVDDVEEREQAHPWTMYVLKASGLPFFTHHSSAPTFTQRFSSKDSDKEIALALEKLRIIPSYFIEEKSAMHASNPSFIKGHDFHRNGIQMDPLPLLPMPQDAIMRLAQKICALKDRVFSFTVQLQYHPTSIGNDFFTLIVQDVTSRNNSEHVSSRKIILFQDESGRFVFGSPERNPDPLDIHRKSPHVNQKRRAAWSRDQNARPPRKSQKKASKEVPIGERELEQAQVEMRRAKGGDVANLAQTVRDGVDDAEPYDETDLLQATARLMDEES